MTEFDRVWERAWRAGEQAGARAGSRWQERQTIEDHGAKLARSFVQRTATNLTPREQVAVLMAYHGSYLDFASAARFATHGLNGWR